MHLLTNEHRFEDGLDVEHLLAQAGAYDDPAWDGGYKFYDLGRGTLTPQSSMRMPQTYWGMKAEIGPAFYPAQTNRTSRVLCDRFVVVHEE